MCDAVAGCAVVECAVVGRAVGVRCDGVCHGGALWWGAPWWGALWWGVPLWGAPLWGAPWWGVVVGRDAGNLYLNSCFCREKVEKPSPAYRKSLPKTGKIGEMGRETKLRLPGIST